MDGILTIYPPPKSILILQDDNDDNNSSNAIHQTTLPSDIAKMISRNPTTSLIDETISVGQYEVEILAAKNFIQSQPNKYVTNPTTNNSGSLSLFKPLSSRTQGFSNTNLGIDGTMKRGSMSRKPILGITNRNKVIPAATSSTSTSIKTIHSGPSNRKRALQQRKPPAQPV